MWIARSRTIFLQFRKTVLGELFLESRFDTVIDRDSTLSSPIFGNAKYHKVRQQIERTPLFVRRNLYQDGLKPKRLGKEKERELRYFFCLRYESPVTYWGTPINGGRIHVAVENRLLFWIYLFRTPLLWVQNLWSFRPSNSISWIQPACRLWRRKRYEFQAGSEFWNRFRHGHNSNSKLSNMKDDAKTIKRKQSFTRKCQGSLPEF